MNMRKVSEHELKGKDGMLVGFDHYVALDWSMQSMAIGHMSPRSRHPRVFERDTDLNATKEYLSSLRGRIVLVIEETTTAQWLYVELREYVTRIILCDPYRNRLLSDGPKTDKVDAAKLCQLLRAGLLKEVFHSTDEVYQLRRLMSAYEDLIKSGVRLKNQRHALYRAHAEAEPEVAFILQHLDTGLSLYEATKKQYGERLKELVSHHRLAGLLQEVTGIGLIGSLTILAIVVDARRFPRSSHYLVYSGLVHFRKQSGGRDYGKRKARYNHSLKRVYKLAAMAAISAVGNPLREYYDVLRARGVAEHNARHAVARYIARITYGILKSGTPYRPYGMISSKNVA